MTAGRVLGGLLLAVVVLAAVCWLISPVVAFHAFREAARAGDRDGLAAVVDYPALRTSLEPQLRAAAEARAAAAPPALRPSDVIGRVLERLGRGAGPVLAPLRLDDDVEAQLEPAALARAADGDIERLEYVTPSRVQVEVSSGPLFVLERGRFVDWRVVHVALRPAPGGPSPAVD